MTDWAPTDLELLLESRSLIGYQIDASHLHDVIFNIIKQVNTSTNNTNRRFVQLENAVSDLDRRVGRIEQAFGDLGDIGEVRNVKDDLRNIIRTVDEIQRQHIPFLQKSHDDNRQRVLVNEKTLQSLSQSISTGNAQQSQLLQAVDDLSRQIQQVDARSVADRALDRNTSERLSVAIADISGRSGKIERELSSLLRDFELFSSRHQNESKLKESLDELSARMNENFRLVEQGANAVDIELGKFRTDLSNLRVEVNTLDNNTRHKLGKITDDVDEKFRMLLETLKAFENNSSAMEEAITLAGRALATNKQNRLSAVSSLSAPTSKSSPASRGQTTTDTNLHLGLLTTDQYQNSGVKPGWF